MIDEKLLLLQIDGMEKMLHKLKVQMEQKGNQVGVTVWKGKIEMLNSVKFIIEEIVSGSTEHLIALPDED